MVLVVLRCSTYPNCLLENGLSYLKRFIQNINGQIAFGEMKSSVSIVYTIQKLCKKKKIGQVFTEMVQCRNDKRFN